MRPEPLPPYEELFASGRGFTDPEEAGRFARESGADWLSVAIGNIHGAISVAAKGLKKVEARLDIAHLERIRRTAGIPLVLHGGTGIGHASSIPSGTASRRSTWRPRSGSPTSARGSAVRPRRRTPSTTRCGVLRDDLEIEGIVDVLNPEVPA